MNVEWEGYEGKGSGDRQLVVKLEVLQERVGGSHPVLALVFQHGFLHDLGHGLHESIAGTGLGHCFANGMMSNELAGAVAGDMRVVLHKTWITHRVVAGNFLQTAS